MKKNTFAPLIPILMTTASLPEVAHAEIIFDRDRVQAECTDKWATDFSMVKYCMDERKEGFDYFQKVHKIVADIAGPTLDYCANKWGHKWDMTAYCTRENLDAMRSVPATTAGLPKETADRILLDCSKKWQPQWDMIAYCTGNQATAWKSINN
ncbi:hypothetical protein [Phaeobacter sp. JH20_26]|uniref:hypothetical protein n=1 Tax=Phaeobacter sp. JH20_26 TaxID=3112483 RepID=UPI003A855039